jgi:hypothetical protein
MGARRAMDHLESNEIQKLTENIYKVIARLGVSRPVFTKRSNVWRHKPEIAKEILKNAGIEVLFRRPRLAPMDIPKYEVLGKAKLSFDVLGNPLIFSPRNIYELIFKKNYSEYARREELGSMDILHMQWEMLPLQTGKGLSRNTLKLETEKWLWRK